jgi:U4/U6 small nuclear ribonucleoprotein PRP31
MSTLADELLNDFENSTSEGEDEGQNGFLQDVPTSTAAGISHGLQRSAALKDSPGSMELAADDDDGEEDEEMADGDILGSERLDEPEDEEETKAKVEKMQLGRVNDVRNVAGLMKTLEPVLEVGYLPIRPFCPE